ncbi:MAG: VWA domain-containing protein [Intestinibacter sp.]
MKYQGEILYRQETHVAVIIVVDTSGSMVPNIAELNNAFKLWCETAKNNLSENDIIDVAVIEYNTDVKVANEFTPLSRLETHEFTAQGMTSTGKALEKAIEMCKKQVNRYRKEGIDAHIPWILLFTDGMPTDSIQNAKQILEEERSKGKYGHVKLWAVATDNADLNTLKELTNRVIYMKDHDYKSMFNWARESMVLLSNSDVNDGGLVCSALPTNTQIVK